MRICFYTETALPKLGGQELVVDALARQFLALGHDITVLTQQPRWRYRPDDASLPYPVVRHPRFFSTHRYDSMVDFTTKAKMFGWEGDPGSIEAWRAGGFKPVVMSATDIVPSLQTGLIDTVSLAPLYAYSSRVFERAKYMMDMPWALLTGAMVVKKEDWDKVPPDVKTKLLG